MCSFNNMHTHGTNPLNYLFIERNKNALSLPSLSQFRCIYFCDHDNKFILTLIEIVSVVRAACLSDAPAHSARRGGGERLFTIEHDKIRTTRLFFIVTPLRLPPREQQLFRQHCGFWQVSRAISSESNVITPASCAKSVCVN